MKIKISGNDDFVKAYKWVMENCVKDSVDINPYFDEMSNKLVTIYDFMEKENAVAFKLTMENSEMVLDF